MTEIQPEIDNSEVVGGERLSDQPVLLRSSLVTDVNPSQRIIEFVAAPYDEEGTVFWRGQTWREVFLRGAWDGIEKRPNRVKINREHSVLHTVGRVTNFWPSRQEGLVGAAKIAKTPLGDETLALAEEDCLAASVGYKARPSDVILNKALMLRSVRRAWVDHMALTVEPVYAGATVLNVRSQGDMEPVLQPLVETPALDDLVAWMQSRNA